MVTWPELQKRVRAREIQLKAWRHMFPAGVVEQTDAQIGVIEIARVLVVSGAIIAAVIAGGHMLAALVAGAVAWPIAALLRALACDAILGRAFATLSPRQMGGLAVAPVMPFAPPSSWAKSVDGYANQKRDEYVPKPKLSETDRDAVDFDDAA